MLKWAVELGQFDVEYKARSAIKGQALADFISEFPLDQESNNLALVFSLSEGETELTIPSPWWTSYVYGAVNNEGAGSGIILVSSEGHHL